MQLGLFVKCAMMHLSGLTSVPSSSFTFNYQHTASHSHQGAVAGTHATG